MKEESVLIPLAAGSWPLVTETLRAKRASRVWLLFASRLAPGEAVEALRAESRELLLMIGKSINTAVARNQGKAIGA